MSETLDALEAGLFTDPLDDVRLFVEALYGHAERGWVTLNWLAPSEPGMRTDWFATDQLGALAERAIELDGRNVYVPIATRRERLARGRGTNEDLADVVALACDVDVQSPKHANPRLPATFEEARAIIAGFALAPSCVVRTGHGLQAWWLLDEPTPFDRATNEVLGRWGDTWRELGRRADRQVDSTASPEHVFRLPGTINGGKRVDFAEVRLSRRYSLTELDEATLAYEAPPRREPVRRPSTSDLPGDRYNAEHTVDELLERAGFVYSHASRSGAERHYVAPHRAARGERQTGATVYADDGHATIWSETFAGAHGLEVRRPYDPFGLFAHLDHGGDFSAAAQALAGSPATHSVGSAHAEAPTDADGTPQESSTGRHVSIELIDWGTLHERPDEIVDGLVFPGRWTAVAAKAKVGKTSLLMYVTVEIAEGRDPFDGRQIDPVTVLYVDAEMGRLDLDERLRHDLQRDPACLSRWHATDLPPRLDTIEGGQALVVATQQLGADVVVIDGINGTVSGAEKDDTTWRAFYDHTVYPLKRLGVAVLTGDNLGKDAALGPRGSSVKIDKPDGVLLATRTDDGLKLHAHVRRTSAYPHDRYLRAYGLDRSEPLRYAVANASWPAGTKEGAELLDRLGVPIGYGRGRTRAMLAEAGESMADGVLSAAIRWRRYLASEGSR